MWTFCRNLHKDFRVTLFQLGAMICQYLVSCTRRVSPPCGCTRAALVCPGWRMFSHTLHRRTARSCPPARRRWLGSGPRSSPPETNNTMDLGVYFKTRSTRTNRCEVLKFLLYIFEICQIIRCLCVKHLSIKYLNVSFISYDLYTFSLILISTL